MNDAVTMTTGAGVAAEWPLSAVDVSRIGFAASNTSAQQATYQCMLLVKVM